MSLAGRVAIVTGADLVLEEQPQFFSLVEVRMLCLRDDGSMH